jgi:hypothetical protein
MKRDCTGLSGKISCLELIKTLCKVVSFSFKNGKARYYKIAGLFVSTGLVQVDDMHCP